MKINKDFAKATHLVSAITASFLLVACDARVPTPAPVVTTVETPQADIKITAYQNMSLDQGVTVVHDAQRSVTCWIYRTESGGYSIRGGGISCMPDWMLKAKEAGQ